MGLSLTSNDFAILQNFSLEIINGPTIEFQFPPKIVSENKKANWDIQLGHVAYEEWKHYTGSSSRSLTLEYEYIVAGTTNNSWNIDRITKQLSDIKSYWYRFALVGGSADLYPFIRLDAYRIAPEIGNGPTFRMTDISINYSDTLITESNGEKVFPLHSKVSIPLELVTKIGPIGGGRGTVGKAKGTFAATRNIPASPKVEWY